VTSDAKKLVLVVVSAAGVAALLIIFFPALLGTAAGPDVEIITTLKNAEAVGLKLDVGDAGILVSTRVSFDRLSVVTTGSHATVTATLDFDGELGHTKVSSLGLERVVFEHRGSDWEPVAGFAPDLVGVVRALEDRRRALESGDLSHLCYDADAGLTGDLEALLKVTHRGVRATAWLIRNERDDVMVSEDYRLSGERPDRPIDDMGTKRLKLQAATGGEFCFPEGLM
jgi:hypothetical protein